MKDEHIEEGKIEVIRNMKAKGFTLDVICEATGYTKDQIRKLLKKAGRNKK